MRSVRALLLAVACSSIARVQASSPREQYVQRMTDCLVPTKRPATCEEYRKLIKNINNNYNPKILTLPQSLSGECYVYARKDVRFRYANETCTQAGGLLPWFVTREEKEEVLKPMFINADSVDIWVGYFKFEKDFSPGNLYESWNGLCPAVATNGLEPIKPEDIKNVFDQLNNDGSDVSARYAGYKIKDRPVHEGHYSFVCMTVILPPQILSPPPPTTSPSTAAVTPQTTEMSSRRSPAPALTASKGSPAPAPTASKAASLATELIIGLVLILVCLIGLSAFLFLIMKKKRQKLEEAQRDAEQQEKTKEKDELSAGATQSQSCYTEGTTATETATPDMTPVMIPVHLGDTKEQCSGRKSCLCAMCKAKKELFGEKIPEKEEEKGVVSLVSDML